jgi:hypothetical protein
VKVIDVIALGLELAGVALVSLAAFMIHRVAGFAVLGLALVLIGEFALGPPRKATP